MFVLVASYGGALHHPTLWFNPQAHPNPAVQMRPARNGYMPPRPRRVSAGDFGSVAANPSFYGCNQVRTDPWLSCCYICLIKGPLCRQYRRVREPGRSFSCNDYTTFALL